MNKTVTYKNKMKVINNSYQNYCLHNYNNKKNTKISQKYHNKKNY